MSSYFIALLTFAQVPLTFLFPYVGVLGWFWIAFLNPHKLVWGPMTDLPFAAIVGAATLLAWAVGRERKLVPMNAVTISLVLLAAWITWTTTQAQVPEEAWKIWDRSIKILLMTYVAIAVMHTRERIHALVWVTVVCFAYFGFKGGVFAIATGGAYRVYGPTGSMIADNNALALALLMVAPYVRYLQLHSANPWVRRALLLVLVMTVFAVIGSLSRGAFLGLIAVGGFLIWKTRYRGRMFALAAAVALVAVWFVPQSWVERMESIQNYEQDASAMARILTWGWAVDLAVQRPLTGGGFEVYRDVELYTSMVPEKDRAHSFHSIYFEMLGQHGFIGLIIFLALAAATWRMLSRTIRLARDHPELQWAQDLAAMSQVSLVAYFVAGAFLNLAMFDLYYVVVAVAMLTYYHAREQRGLEPAVSPASSRPGGRYRRSPSGAVPARRSAGGEETQST